jgi:two-component system LytT family response regulator
MIRAVIVDDERHVRQAMAELIGRYCADVDVVGLADSVPSAIDVIGANNPDIVFLDIEMPEHNGFELLAAFAPVPFKVVVVTAYDRYAIRAIKLSALDYLLKPVDPFELRAAVVKAASASTNAPVPDQIELMREHAADRSLTKVAIPTEDGFVFVALGDIVRCRSESNYTRIHLAGGGQLLSSRTLGDFEGLLCDSEFFRVHNSHLINMRHALRYHKGKGGVVVMSDGAEVEVSVRRKDAFIRSIKRI